MINSTPHTRAKIELSSRDDIVNFIYALCDGSTDFYNVENFNRTEIVNARSILGMLYASSEFDSMFLVNITTDGRFPASIDKFRKP